MLSSAVHSYAAKSGSAVVSEAAYVLRILTPLAPARVTRELVAAANVALAPDAPPGAAHLAPHVLVALVHLVPPLLFPVPHLAPSLMGILHDSLPGIDPNDATKTAAALAFFTSVVHVIPIGDIDEAVGDEDADDETLKLPPWHPSAPDFSGVPLGAYVPPLLAAAVVARGGASALPETAFFCKKQTASGIADRLPDGRSIGVQSSELDGALDESGFPTSRLFRAAAAMREPLSEWALAALDRALKVLESRDKPSEGRGGKSADSVASLLAQFAFSLVAAAGPNLQKGLLSRVTSWVARTPPLECGKDVAIFLASFVAAAPARGVPALAPALVAKSLDTTATQPARTWALLLLHGVVKHAGAAAAPLAQSIIAVADAVWSDAASEQPLLKAAAKVVRCVLKTMLSTLVDTAAPHQSPTPSFLSWAAPTAWVTPADESARSFSPPPLLPVFHEPR